MDDLAAHAEIGEHGLERGGIFADRVDARSRALRSFRRGKQVERGEGVAVGRPARAAAPLRPPFLRAPRLWRTPRYLDSSSASSVSSAGGSERLVPPVRDASSRGSTRAPRPSGGRRSSAATVTPATPRHRFAARPARARRLRKPCMSQPSETEPMSSIRLLHAGGVAPTASRLRRRRTRDRAVAPASRCEPATILQQ